MDWYRAHGARADLSLAKAGDEMLGHTLVSQWNTTLQVNEIVELGRDKKPRWKIENLGFAFDFEVLPGSRLLCPEFNGHRVTERNFKGEVLWEHKISNPINAQRLPGGNTFIAATTAVLVVDRAGKELVRNDKLRHIMMGQRLPSGQMVVVLSDGSVVRLDAAGKEVKRFTLGFGVNNYSGAHALPDGRLLVPIYDRNLVVEFDADGKQLWKAEVKAPGSATRLPNGNTLAGSQNARALLELDRQGNVRWEYKPDLGIWRARRR
jgi:outer membrane protein assembly factor BamB